jgi:hypothetical protein
MLLTNSKVNQFDVLDMLEYDEIVKRILRYQLIKDKYAHTRRL